MTTPHTGAAQPLLSICLPVYNGAEYLPNVLAALLSQADELRELVEVMVADDASQDASEQICAEAAAAGRIRYVRNCPNLGMGPNIARCI
ncbi:MAG: glycosyltransferase family 2 protein, partial [Planctomyces sp.]